jgi:hypothetical protein
LLLQTDLDDYIGLVAVAGFYVVAAVLAVLFYLSKTRRQELAHKERLALIERVELLPENIRQLVASLAPDPARDLRTGLIWSTMGIGASIVLYAVQETRPYWAFGLIPLFIGVAYLVSFWAIFRRRGEAADNRGVLAIQSRPSITESVKAALPVGETPEQHEMES